MNKDPVGGKEQETSAAAEDWASPTHVRMLALFLAAGLGLYLCYRLALPFLPALAWSVALAVVFAPLQRRLEAKLRRPGLAAFASLLVIVLIVVIPASFVAQRLAVQVARGAELIETQVKSGEWRAQLESRPALGRFAERIDERIDLPGIAASVVAWLSATTGKLVKGSLLQLAGFVLTFYLLFYFLRDRRLALVSLRRLLPLRAEEVDRLIARVDDTIHAIVYGTLAVSSVQGFLGGLMFWWLGLPAPLLWGVMMALLAVVPVLGAFVVWIPAAAFLLLQGSWGKAVVLVAWGILVVGTIDNLLRPILVGNRLRLHTVLVFISIVGGLALFGTAGLVLGPGVLAVTAVLLEALSDRLVPATTQVGEVPALPPPESGVVTPAPAGNPESTVR